MNKIQEQDLLDHVDYLKSLLFKEEQRNSSDAINISVAVGLINEVLVMLSAARNSPYKFIDVSEFDQIAWKERALNIVEKLGDK